MAVQISQVIFPTGDKTIALMQTLGLMGVAYIARPIGAFVLGRMADRSGRRPAMLLSFALAGTAVLGQALVPSHAAIGIAAPLLMLAFRLLLGFALGGEFGSSMAMLVEAAPPHRRGAFVALQLSAQDLGILLAGVVATLLAISLSASQLVDYGWRAALLLGTVIVPVGLLLRKRLPETLFVSAAAEGNGRAPHARTVSPQLTLTIVLLLAALLVADGIKYLGIYAQTVLSLEPKIAFSATIAISIAAIVFSLLGGRLSDAAGRRPILIAGLAATAICILPCFWLLNLVPGLSTLILVSGLLASALAFASPAITITLAEMMPRHSRATGLGLVAAIAVALINGTGDLFFTWIIHVTADPLAPAWCMTIAGGLALALALRLPETRPKPSDQQEVSRGDTAPA